MKPVGAEAVRALWFALGGANLALGVLGALLPLLPTTPFIILAAFCFAKCSPALHARLLRSPTFGPAIRNWRERRAISKRGKIASVAAMSASLILSFALGVELAILGVQALVLSGAASFILTRNSA